MNPSPPVRITWITHYAELYGANRSMLDLMLELKRTGRVLPSVILPREGALCEQLQAAAIPFRVVPFLPWMSERRYMGGPHHRLMQRWRYSMAARERRRTNLALLPTIAAQVKGWNAQAVHLNSTAVPLGVELKRQVRLPLIWHIREMPERQYLLHIDVGRRRFGRALRNADRLIAISQAVKDDIQRYTGPMPDLPVIYNGVLRHTDQVALHAQGRERWSRNVPFTFVLVGLIHPSKGQVEAVEALALLRRTHPAARLVIVGDGRDAALREAIQRTGQTEAVELQGFRPDPFPALIAAHALLMCSRNEAMGRVTVEAMACGLPVIGHASGGTVELVEDGHTGLLYSAGPEELAERMSQLVSDHAWARQLGDTGAERARARFSIERYAQEVADIHRKVLSPA
jgi:glycosyltransferase involved in cell wall biosynthesis